MFSKVNMGRGSVFEIDMESHEGKRGRGMRIEETR